MSTTVVVSVNDLNINAPDGGYIATLVQSYVQPDAVLSQAQRDGDSPLATNVAPGALEFILTVLVDARTADADTVDARRRALLRALDTTAAPLTLVIKNAKGTARERYMRFVNMKADQVVGQFGEGFAARLVSADDVRWRSTARVELTQGFTETGTWVVNCLGDLDAWPTYTLKPLAPRETPVFPYFRAFTILWRSPWGGEHPVDITGGGLNTAALKTAGKVTNSTNIGVMFDGRYVPFWYGGADGQPGGFNSTTTRLWVNATFSPATMAYTTSYVSETATTIYVRDDANLPQSGVLSLEGELITFAFRAPGVLYGVQRGALGSEAFDHVAGAEIEPIRVGMILYGPAGAVPAAARDYAYTTAKPPVFLDGVSTNATWHFNGNFHDTTKTHPWRYDWFGNSGTAFVKASAADGSFSNVWGTPWTAMGFKPGWASYSSFRHEFAIPLKRARAIGRRRASGSAAQWPSTPKLYFDNPDTQSWRIMWDSGEGVERVANPPFDVTTADAVGAPLFNRIRWAFVLTNFVQTDIQQLYVTFHDGYLPVINVGDEDTGYDLDMRIENTTTGEALVAEHPNMVVGQGLVIDSELMTARYGGQNVYSAVQRRGNNPIRPRFMRLVPGQNILTVTEEGMGSFEITISYEPRYYA